MKTFDRRKKRERKTDGLTVHFVESGKNRGMYQSAKTGQTCDETRLTEWLLSNFTRCDLKTMPRTKDGRAVEKELDLSSDERD